MRSLSPSCGDFCQFHFKTERCSFVVVVVVHFRASTIPFAICMSELLATLPIARFIMRFAEWWLIPSRSDQQFFTISCCPSEYLQS
jgi:hypothetical protein